MTVDEPRSTDGPATALTAPRTRQHHTRSRAGCITCRKRHRRCDENRPIWYVLYYYYTGLPIAFTLDHPDMLHGVFVQLLGAGNRAAINSRYFQEPYYTSSSTNTPSVSIANWHHESANIPRPQSHSGRDGPGRSRNTSLVRKKYGPWQ